MSFPNDTPHLIQNEAQLATFRTEHLTVEKTHQSLALSGGKLLNNLPPGVGKSVLARHLVQAHREGGPHDVLVYLVSQRRILLEQDWAAEVMGMSSRARQAHDVAVLERRPSRRCGDLDAAWKAYEAAGCGTAGRETVCGACPRRRGCSWPEQLSKDQLGDKRVIAGTQAYLAALPDLVRRLKTTTGADRVLVVLDEPAILDAPLRRSIDYATIAMSKNVLERVAAHHPGKAVTAWLTVHDQVLDPAADLRDLRLPRLPAAVVVGAQKAGMAAYGPAFRFLGFELPGMLWSSSWRRPDGRGIDYIARPLLALADYVILAAGLPLAVARHRLGEPGLQEFCPNIRVQHQETQLYNLRSHTGAAIHFSTHSRQILFAAAQLVLKLADDRKRTVLVVKKRFAPVAAAQLQRYLRELSNLKYCVVVNPAKKKILEEPLVVPLITYGVQGTNLYEEFDAAIAVSSYNVNPDALAERLNEPHRPGEEVRLEFTQQGGRRVAVVVGYAARLQGFEALARAYHEQYELAVVKQALGRVRYATRPRTVLFFQTGEIDLPLTGEFASLEELRQHFGLENRRRWTRCTRARAGQELRDTGLTIAAIAQRLGITERTVYRYLRGRVTRDVYR